MVEALPFQALMYDLEAIPDLSPMICPPYDVISDQMRRHLYQQNPFNIVRLEYSQETGSDEGRYDQAAKDLQNWIGQGVLKPTERASFYLLTQSYLDAYGSQRRRKVLIARVRLERFSEGSVLPHEFTIPKAKKDRLKLLTKCETNFSPIMAVYRDLSGSITTVLNSDRVSRNIMTSGTISDEGEFTLAEISDTDDVDTIKEAFKDTPVLIADGHHRYETALEYSQASEKAGAQYVMMGLIALDDSGLDIHGYHRVVSGVAEDTMEALMSHIEEKFDKYRSVSLPQDVRVRAQEVERLLVSPDQVNWDVILVNATGNASLLKVREDRVTQGSETILPIRLLEECLSKVIQDDESTSSPLVDYDHNVTSAVTRVSEGNSTVGFIMGSLAVDLFEKVVISEGRLPRKSTYFYPKLPAGVVMYPLWSE